MPKFQPLDEAVAECLAPGNTAAFEGFTHLIPHAAAHAAIRAGIGGLTVVRMTPDLIYDQMIGMGLIKRLVFSYAGNPGVGLLRRFRDAVENGWPQPLEIEEHSHAAIANAYEAAAAGLPFGAFRGYLGSGLPEVNPKIRTVACPFTGEMLAAVPAMKLDAAFIHAQKADRKGNVLIEGILGVQKQAALAAKRTVVTVEEIVDDLNAHPNACVLPHWTVAAISEVPGGAHPSYARGYYERDNAAYIEWDRISGDRERFREWMQENVIESEPGAFEKRVRRLRTGE